MSDNVTNHELLIREKAGQLQNAKGSMSVYEVKKLEMKQAKETRRETEEKSKSNAISQAKYNEIIDLSAELEGYLKGVSDWSSASLAEVIAGMNSLEKLGKIFSDLNKSRREFATASFPLPEENEKVLEIIHDMEVSFNNEVWTQLVFLHAADK